jgi:hypothetical protein
MPKRPANTLCVHLTLEEIAAVEFALDIADGDYLEEHDDIYDQLGTVRLKLSQLTTVVSC